MTKYKHLSLSDRIDIDKYLNYGFNYSQIGRILNKSDRTIAYEIKNTNKELKKNNFNNTKYFPCEKLNHTPFVCNGCNSKISCRKKGMNTSLNKLTMNIIIYYQVLKLVLI